jgi:hypothetical protein
VSWIDKNFVDFIVNGVVNVRSSGITDCAHNAHRLPSFDFSFLDQVGTRMQEPDDPFIVFNADGAVVPAVGVGGEVAGYGGLEHGRYIIAGNIKPR